MARQLFQICSIFTSTSRTPSWHLLSHMTSTFMYNLISVEPRRAALCWVVIQTPQQCPLFRVQSATPHNNSFPASEQKAQWALRGRPVFCHLSLITKIQLWISLIHEDVWRIRLDCCWWVNWQSKSIMNTSGNQTWWICRGWLCIWHNRDIIQEMTWRDCKGGLQNFKQFADYKQWRKRTAWLDDLIWTVQCRWQ